MSLRSILIFIIVAIAGMVLAAEPEMPAPPPVKVQFIRGRYHFVDEYGDTVLMTVYKDFHVFKPLKFKNKKEEEFYWRTVRDVRRTLPYAKLASEALAETYEYIMTIPDKKEREKHLKNLEKDIFNQYKPILKGFTRTQGKVMLKLINRETSQSSYNIVKAFLGSFRAGFWQTFGRFFGLNMKVAYEPDKNKEDAIIERIAILIEQGAL